MILTYVRGDDWEALYDGDRLVSEGHRISAHEALSYVWKKEAYEFIYEMKLADMEWLSDRGNFPVNLSEVKFEEE